MQPQCFPGNDASALVTVENKMGAWKQETIRTDTDSRSSALDALFLLNPQIMWVYDRDTLRFLEVNDAAIAHYGYSREEFLSLSLSDIRPLEDIPRLLESVVKLSDSTPLSSTGRHRTKDGRTIHVEVHVRAISFIGKRAALAVVQDITARVEAEAERERLLSELHYIASASRCLFWQADLKAGGPNEGLCWQITAPVQQNAARLFPVLQGPTENFYSAWYRSRLPEDCAATNAYADQQIRAGRSFTREFRFRTKDDEIRWASEDVNIEVVEPDKAWRAVGVVTDITERKRAEETLRYMMDSAQCLLWYADVEQVNDAGEMNWRLSIPTETTAAQRFLPLEVPPGTPYALVWEQSRHPDDHDVMNLRAQRYISQNQGYSQEFRCFDKYGKIHWLKEDVHVEPVGPGRWRAAGVCTDISRFKESEDARKSAVDALADSEERYRTVVESVRDAIFQTDAEGLTTFLNEAWEEITGYSVAESIGCSLTEIIIPEHQEAYATLWATLKSGGLLLSPSEFSCHSQTGQPLWLEVSAHATFDAEGRFSGVLGIIRDTTERKRMMAQMVRTEKLAALGELAAGVAHEINNPLSVASAMSQFLEMHTDTEVQGDANTIRRMLERIARIVHSLRIFSYDGRKQPKRPVPISTIIDDALNVVGTKLRHAEISVECTVSENLPDVMVNEGEIEQVLVNLLMNAEYALRPLPPEARQVRLSVYRDTPRPTDEEEWLCVTIQDNGIGIPDDIKSRIFDPFFTTKDIGEGTGLGLSICHGIIQSHGGTLTVESEVGKGTTFILTLPGKG